MESAHVARSVHLACELRRQLLPSSPDAPPLDAAVEEALRDSRAAWDPRHVATTPSPWASCASLELRDVFDSPLGYFQLKGFLVNHQTAAALDFVEAALRFRRFEDESHRTKVSEQMMACFRGKPLTRGEDFWGAVVRTESRSAPISLGSDDEHASDSPLRSPSGAGSGSTAELVAPGSAHSSGAASFTSDDLATVLSGVFASPSASSLASSSFGSQAPGLGPGDGVATHDNVPPGTDGPGMRDDNWRAMSHLHARASSVLMDSASLMSPGASLGSSARSSMVAHSARTTRAGSVALAAAPAARSAAVSPSPHAPDSPTRSASTSRDPGADEPGGRTGDEDGVLRVRARRGSTGGTLLLSLPSVGGALLTSAAPLSPPPSPARLAGPVPLMPGTRSGPASLPGSGRSTPVSAPTKRGTVDLATLAARAEGLSHAHDGASHASPPWRSRDLGPKSVPFLLLDAFRAAGLRLRTTEEVWVSVETLMTMGPPPAELYDEMIVLVLDDLERFGIHAFRRSPFMTELVRLERFVERFLPPEDPAGTASAVSAVLGAGSAVAVLEHMVAHGTTDAASVAALLRPAPAVAVGAAQFSWLGRLGRGGYGSVFACEKRDTGRLYAVKCMDKRLIKARKAQKLVLTERDVLAAVDDGPFLTGLKYAFHTDEEVCFVMDLMPGGDLESLLTKRGALNESLARFYLAEVVLALRFLHEHGIMHRDLKPANILLGADGHVSLSDLGLAAFVSSGSLELAVQAAESAAGRSAVGRTIRHRGISFRRHTGGQVRVNGHLIRPYLRGKAGTPGFWAPEMLARETDGRPGRYDASADWWSFGCLMYALLVGRGPFTVRGGNTDDDNFATLHHDPTYPSDLISPVAKDLLVSLLQRDPSHRRGARGSDDIMHHPWFHGMEWSMLEDRLLTPPWRPTPGPLSLDVKPSAKDVARTDKLRTVKLSEEDQTTYLGVPFASRSALCHELIDGLVGESVRGASSICRSILGAARRVLRDGGGGAPARSLDEAAHLLALTHGDQLETVLREVARSQSSARRVAPHSLGILTDAIRQLLAEKSARPTLRAPPAATPFSSSTLPPPSFPPLRGRSAASLAATVAFHDDGVQPSFVLPGADGTSIPGSRSWWTLLSPTARTVQPSPLLLAHALWRLQITAVRASLAAGPMLDVAVAAGLVAGGSSSPSSPASGISGSPTGRSAPRGAVAATIGSGYVAGGAGGSPPSLSTVGPWSSASSSASPPSSVTSLGVNPAWDAAVCTFVDRVLAATTGDVVVHHLVAPELSVWGFGFEHDGEGLSASMDDGMEMLEGASSEEEGGEEEEEAADDHSAGATVDAGWPLDGAEGHEGVRPRRSHPALFLSAAEPAPPGPAVPGAPRRPDVGRRAGARTPSSGGAPSPYSGSVRPTCREGPAGSAPPPSGERSGGVRSAGSSGGGSCSGAPPALSAGLTGAPPRVVRRPAVSLRSGVRPSPLTGASGSPSPTSPAPLSPLRSKGRILAVAGQMALSSPVAVRSGPAASSLLLSASAAVASKDLSSSSPEEGGLSAPGTPRKRSGDVGRGRSSPPRGGKACAIA